MRQFRTGFRRVSTGIRRDRDAPLALGRCAVGRGGRSSILHQDATTYTPNAGHVTSHPDNAGHPAGWVLPLGGTAGRTSLEPTGPLLSALGGTWATRSAPLAVGDVLLAWSDGLVEARDADLELSDDDLAAVVDRIGTREPRELVAQVLADLREDAPEWRRDDVTLLAVRRVA